MRHNWIIGLGVLGLMAMLAGSASAHCDAMDGPVVVDAQKALADGEVRGVLKWVAAEDESEVTQVFEQALRVRAHGGESRELADRHFFETLVRLHRQSEGAAYTGLKPAGTPVEASVRAVDAAMESGEIDGLIVRLQALLEQQVRERFDAAQKAAREAGEDVEAGREAVHAYVELVHYVKHVHDTMHGEGHGAHAAHE